MRTKRKKPAHQGKQSEETKPAQPDKLAEQSKLAEKDQQEIKTPAVPMRVVSMDDVVKALDQAVFQAKSKVESKLMDFLRYVAGMDQAFYRRPNDWHIGLEMTARAQTLLSELEATEKRHGQLARKLSKGKGDAWPRR